MQTTPVAATVKNQFNLHVINCPSVWFCYSGVKTLSIDRLRRTPSLSRGLSPTVNEFHHHLLSILKPKLIFTEHSVHVLLKSLLPSRVHVCLQRVFNMQESVYKSQSSTVIDNRQQRGAEVCIALRHFSHSTWLMKILRAPWYHQYTRSDLRPFHVWLL